MFRPPPSSTLLRGITLATCLLFIIAPNRLTRAEGPEAAAREVPPPHLPEVVVTASRHEATTFETPFAVDVIDGDIEVRKANVGDGWVQGVELAGAYDVTPDWSVSLATYWNDGEVDVYPTSERRKERRPLTRLQPTTAQIGLLWKPPAGRWWAECLARVVDNQDQLSPGDERDTSRIPPGGSPGYTVYTLRGGARILPNLDATLALENLTDKGYRPHGSGQNESGFQAVGVLDWRF